MSMLALNLVASKLVIAKVNWFIYALCFRQFEMIFLSRIIREMYKKYMTYIVVIRQFS